MASTEKDVIVCNGCGNETERTAPEGVELQASSTFVCDDCANTHNDKVGATKQELEASQELRKTDDSSSKK
jgi:ribosome-binding protein aMBF1 (putative translation factor)